MRAVIQRVLSASVRVNNELVGQTEAGLLALIGVEVGDTERDL
ncbi:MAG: D-aminoacyl-tRNA deacylase, partial [Clostridia bacterium]